jgi:glycosyltransferase involved in cell wall biosynthesis
VRPSAPKNGYLSLHAAESDFRPECSAPAHGQSESNSFSANREKALRIGYIAPYQGPELVKKRPSLHNLSLAARVKVQLIAELLRKSSHEVEIISQGEVDRREFRYYGSFCEAERFHADIPIHYLSALPVRYLTGIWESACARRLLKARHGLQRFDAVIIYNLKRAQIACAHFAIHRLGLPVILEYEDDAFVDVFGQAGSGLMSNYHRNRCRRVLRAVSGAMGVSPYLLSQLPDHTPKLLLRGVVSGEILRASQQAESSRKNWVVFSGTHEGTQGLEQLIKAWGLLKLPDWELHIAGQGPLKPTLEKIAEGNKSIVFRGWLNREENARMLCSAKIGMNPQDITRTPGNVFALKIVEYLAAGAHVITTPRGNLEQELEVGLTYIPDNSPDTIAATLSEVILERRYERTAAKAALQAYGPETIAKALNRLLEEAVTSCSARR